MTAIDFILSHCGALVSMKDVFVSLSNCIIHPHCFITK
jgi:hypothetical protein